MVLLRFRELDGGRAVLDGRDLSGYAAADVRRVIGLAAQDAHLSNTSIRENLHLARPDVDQDALDAAAAKGRILDWIGSLPDGWDTLVGEQGVQVSGGHRQRIALTRVLLAGFPIVALDEPTANLDPATECALLHDLLDATTGRATLLITHRLTGLDRVDEALVEDEDLVVERGTHAELLARGGRYHPYVVGRAGRTGGPVPCPGARSDSRSAIGGRSRRPRHEGDNICQSTGRPHRRVQSAAYSGGNWTVTSKNSSLRTASRKVKKTALAWSRACSGLTASSSATRRRNCSSGVRWALPEVAALPTFNAARNRKGSRLMRSSTCGS
jgi:ABC-type multidrug transport system ATPase subunit